MLHYTSLQIGIENERIEYLNYLLILRTIIKIYAIIYKIDASLTIFYTKYLVDKTFVSQLRD